MFETFKILIVLETMIASSFCNEVQDNDRKVNFKEYSKKINIGSI